MKCFCFILFLPFLLHVNVSIEWIDLAADFELAKHQVRLICFFCISERSLQNVKFYRIIPEQWKPPTRKSWPGWARRLLSSSWDGSATLPHWVSGLCAPGICCTDLHTFKLKHTDVFLSISNSEKLHSRDSRKFVEMQIKFHLRISLELSCKKR